MDEIELGPIERGWGSALGKGAGVECPSASDLVEFVDRGESASRFETVVAHLAMCPNCRTVVSEMREADAALAPKRRGFGGLLRPSAVVGGLIGATAVLAVGSVIVVTQLRSVHEPSGVRVARGPKAGHPGGSQIVLRSAPNPPRLISGGKPVERVAANRGETSPTQRPGSAPAVSGTPNDIDDPSMPPTSQQYCLVGSEGVFTMPSPNFRRSDREQIEKKYADQVKAAHEAYKSHVASQPDVAPATAELNRGLVAAGAERERALGAIYARQPSDLGETLDLKLESETPYQVVEVRYRTYRHALKPVKLVVHEPWTGYHPNRKPYGWDYGVAYAPEQFKSKYAEWRRTYVAEGRPAFCGLEGHAGPVTLPNIVGSRYEGYADRRGAGGPVPNHYTHDTDGTPEYAQSRPGTRPGTNGVAGYSHAITPTQNGAGASARVKDGVQSPNPSGADSPAPASGHSGYTHSGSQSPMGGSYGRQTQTAGGYAHSPIAPGSGYSHAQKGSSPNSSYTHQHRDKREGEKGGL